MKTTRTTHSVSSCREYETCPRRYRFAYVDREPARRHVPPSWRMGSAVHEALEAAYRHRQVRGGDGPMDDCVSAANAALHHAWERLELGDHKVTRWERTEADLASDFQLNLYGWLATKMWPWASLCPESAA